MKRVGRNDGIFTRCQGDASLQTLKTLLHLPAETRSGDFFERTVDAF